MNKKHFNGHFPARNRLRSRIIWNQIGTYLHSSDPHQNFCVPMCSPYLSKKGNSFMSLKTQNILLKSLPASSASCCSSLSSTSSSCSSCSSSSCSSSAISSDIEIFLISGENWGFPSRSKKGKLLRNNTLNIVFSWIVVAEKKYYVDKFASNVTTILNLI